MRAMDDDVEAVLQYGDADYRIIKNGTYVTCAVTGARIPLIALRYWSVDRQEAYADAAAATARLRSGEGEGAGS